MNGQVDVGARARTGTRSGSLRRWVAGADAAGSDSGRQLSVCLYTPSADPSGMGEHMLDLVAEYVPDIPVSLLCWPTEPGQRVLSRAGRLGPTPLPLPHPRDPTFADVIADFLHAHPADVFHVHVGTGREDFGGARAARAAGVPAIVQTQ